MKKRIVYLVVLILVITVCLSSCTSNQKENDDELKIVTTVFSIYDWTRNITGNDENIVYLQGSGSDMHSYEPSANDLINLKNADVFIYVGGESDKWIEKARESVNNDSLTELCLIDYIQPLDEEEKEGMQKKHSLVKVDEDEEEKDEHIWLSLKNAKVCVEKICNTLCSLDKNNAEKYSANKASYINKIEHLQTKYTAIFSEKTNKTIVVADRFPFLYLTDEFNIDYFAAFKGCSAESEASFETVKFLLDKIENLGVKSVFVLENSNRRLAQSLSTQTNTTVVCIDSLQSVSLEETKNKDYLTVMDNNLGVISSTL